ncbi:PEF-CTERM sorting domain-containing protein [Methanolobus chelungpuianus]|uniref:PEF-CTERM protein sorting domain-containing protein n=1 Tax=Methanolobus chelungpuianus TaxID=502115 RepID=A0AAE3HC91_9EURY|nr:PEF-CTERM sorting domain-containing protein [Methanolobus chelungpuianus]MCQ6963408.1 hypothetical protein [Methanolobus chelungpuianus]
MISSLATPASAFAGGDGSADDPYQISNVYELQAMSNGLDAHYVLINDINAYETINWDDGAGFEPIGDRESPFNGVFNGQNYKITGLYVSFGDGLFGTIGQSALIKNIRLIGIHIWNGSSALAGRNDGTIDNAYVTGGIGFDSLSGLTNAAGFVYTNSGVITNSYAGVCIITEESATGFVRFNSGTISNSYATGGLSGGRSVTGFTTGGTIINSYSNAYVETGGYDDAYEYFFFSSDNVTSSYWNAGKTTLQITGGQGRTAAEMTYPHALNTYVGWDFENVWAIDKNVNGGYPYLQVQADMMPRDDKGGVDDCDDRSDEIPEFPTIALPIAATLGFAFFFQRRKE